MTIWSARRARRRSGRDILCGRIVDDRHVCPNVIAWVYAIEAEDRIAEAPDVVIIPTGLIEVVPGSYEWSGDAKSRMPKRPLRDRRKWAPRPKGLDGIVQVLQGRGPRPYQRAAQLPIEVPCQTGHQSRIETSTLMR